MAPRSVPTRWVWSLETFCCHHEYLQVQRNFLLSEEFDRDNSSLDAVTGFLATDDYNNTNLKMHLFKHEITVYHFGVI